MAGTGWTLSPCSPVMNQWPTLVQQSGKNTSGGCARKSTHGLKFRFQTNFLKDSCCHRWLIALELLPMTPAVSLNASFPALPGEPCRPWLAHCTGCAVSWGPTPASFGLLSHPWVPRPLQCAESPVGPHTHFNLLSHYGIF